jgi:FKBP-type peptidyl-prolyl cis-trans isomerase
MLRFACVLALFSSAAAVAATAAPPKTSAADAAKAFGLEPSAILETVDLTGDGKLLKHVLVHGTGATATSGATVHAHYDGRLATSFSQFDSSRKRGTPFTFILGGGRVIRGWDKGFEGMRVGEKAILQIDSSLGYGARGAGGAIGPNAELLFEVELVKIEGGKSAGEL